MEIKLAITLRILAGASYLDLVWYGVQVDSVHPIFLFTLRLLDKILPNEEIFNFDPAQANFAEEVNKMASEWSSIRKRGHDCFKGTVMTGDGLVVSITAPTESDRRGLDLAAFRNRKDCYAINVQAFCDAYCRFRYFEVSWPGSTDDITAYKQTDLYRWFTQKLIYECFHMVLDEAYGSIIGGNQHFTKSQLRSASGKSALMYQQMKTFHNFLSSQRITIERASLGIVRPCKWGILWRPLEFDLDTNTLILTVCAKLHNVAINRWIKCGVKADLFAEAEANYI